MERIEEAEARVGTTRVVERACDERTSAGVPADEWCGLEELRDVLRACVARRCADTHEVDDVVQETYLRAMRYRGRLHRGASLRSWTIRIALNVLADRRRRDRRLVASSDEALESCVSEGPGDTDGAVRIGRFDVEREDAVELLRRSLGALREADRQLLGAHYGGEESCRETALRCDVPATAVKVRLFRARRRLCRAMRHRIALEHASPARAAGAGAAEVSS